MKATKTNPLHCESCGTTGVPMYRGAWDDGERTYDAPTCEECWAWGADHPLTDAERDEYLMGEEAKS